MQFTIARDLSSLQQALAAAAAAGQRVALVPTMGALHDGHLTLIGEAQKLAECVVVSIFVNPTQFGANEDFTKYPRMLDQDCEKVRAAGGLIVYAPDVADMYPQGFSTSISVGAMGNILCGKSRSGHFDGVATVVAKLLLRVLPHAAVFGEKDYQQVCIINKLVNELDMPIEVFGVPTVREADGLAMSSRNAYLSAPERSIAGNLYKELQHTAQSMKSGMPVAQAIAGGVYALVSHGFRVDYLELRAPFTLEPMETFAVPARLLVAAWLGKTRLIDNIALE